VASNLRLLAAFACILVHASALSAQSAFKAVGPNECLNCHDHENERTWYEKKEIPEVQRLFPDKGANAGHINSLKQLETPKSKEFAAAIGLADKYDLNGACVQCHATVFAGDANAGVSCESCHGPASGYLKPHQTKDAYEESVSRYGMTRLVGNVQGWTQQCTNCHVMNDDRLIKAGHPSGDDFDLGKKFQPVSVHFKKKYDPAQVGAIGRSEMAGIIRRRRPNAAPLAPEPAAAPGAAAQAGTPEPVSATPAAPPAASTQEPRTPPDRPARPAPARRAARPEARRPASSDPPPGSPTSIEPPAPLPADAAAATPAPTTPPASVTIVLPESLASELKWVVLGGLLLIVGVGAFLWGRSRR
jgi:Cytochrome c554 and c-prime